MFWIGVAILGLQLVSMVLHHSHNVKLQAVGNDLDVVKDMLGQVKK